MKVSYVITTADVWMAGPQVAGVVARASGNAEIHRAARIAMKISDNIVVIYFQL